MNNAWRETFLIHSRTTEFHKKVYEADEIIACALRKHQKPYVAFSGGKDSTCVLHLVLQQRPDTMVLHWDYGRYYIPRPIHTEIVANAKKIFDMSPSGGGKGEEIRLRIETSEKYDQLGKNARNVIGTEMIEKLIPQLIKEGYDAVFVGLRAQESIKRKLRIKAGRALSAIPEIWPVQSWSWLDVWAYIVSNNIPYLSYYDRYGPVVGWDKARFTTLFDPEFDKLGASNVDGVLSWRFRNN